MSDRARLILALGVTGLMCAGALGFVCWLAWSAFWDVFDYGMERWKRCQNERRKGCEWRVGRVYRSRS